MEVNDEIVKKMLIVEESVNLFSEYNALVCSFVKTGTLFSEWRKRRKIENGYNMLPALAHPLRLSLTYSGFQSLIFSEVS